MPKSQKRPYRQYLIATAALLMMHAEVSRAAEAGPMADSRLASGGAAMLSLRVPFGGAPTPLNRPASTLAFGPVAGSGEVGAFQNRVMPVAEAGFALNGEPLLRIGSLDL